MNANTSLACLFDHYGSDKTTNGYAGLYECMFKYLRYQPVTLMEIGIGTMIPGVWSSMKGYMPDSYQPGASLRAWRDYFPKGDIIGMDLQPDTQFSEPRIRTILTDSRDGGKVTEMLDQLGVSAIDIIIDDGSHSVGDQMATLAANMPRVVTGGTYVIEDSAAGPGLIDIAKEVVGNMPMFLLGPSCNMLVISNCRYP